MNMPKPLARIGKIIWPRRTLRRVLVVLGVSLVAGAAGAAAFVLSDAGRDALAPRLVAALAPDGGAITYGALKGDWPHQIIAEDIHIRDRDGEWLSADRIELDWAPWRLLRRVADVTLLRIEHPRIDRLPAEAAETAPAEKENTGIAGLNLPVDIHLRALQIIDGEMIAPVKTGFKADGRADIEKGRVVAQLDAARVGGPDEHIHLDGAFDSIDRTLHLDGDVRTAPQGLLAALVGFPELPPVTLTVKGTGPAENWTLALAGNVAGYGAAQLDGKLTWRETVTLDLAGTVNGGKELGPFVRRLMADGITLDAHWTREAGVDEVKAAASSAAMDLNVNAQLGAETLLKARVLTGSISTQTKQPLILSEDAKLGAFKGSATLSGSIKAPDISTTFDAEDVVADNVHARGLKGVVALESREGAAETRYHAKAGGTAEDVTQGGQSLFDEATWALDATRQGDDYEVTELTVSGQGLDVAASGHFNDVTGIGAGEAKLDAAELAALSPFIGEDLSGAGRIAIKASRADAAVPWQVDMNGTMKDLVVAGTAFTPIAGPEIAIAAQGTVGDDGAIVLSEAMVKGAILALSGNGALSPKLDATVAAAGDLSVLGPLADLTASGPLKATVKATGTLAQPQLDITARSDAAVIEDYNLGSLTARLVPRGGALLADSAAHIEAKGPLGNASLDAPVKHADHRWTVGPIDGSAYGAKISGAIAAAAAGTTGSLTFLIGDLAAAAPVLMGEGTRAEGRARVALTFNGKAGINADVTARGLALPDSEVSVSALTVSAALGRVVDVKGTLTGGALPGVHSPIYYDRLALTAEGPRDAIKVALTSAGLTGASGSLSAHGTLNLAAATRTLDVEDLSGRAWDNPFALNAPARLSFGAAGTALTPARLRLEGSGDITLSYASDLRGERGALQLSELGVPFLGRVLGVEWPRGVIDGAAKFDTDPRRAGGSVRFTLKDAYFTQATKERMTPMHGSVTGDWNGKVFTLDSSFSRDTGTPIVVAGRLPLEARGADGFAFNPRGAVAGKVQWEGRVGTLWTFLPLDLYRVDGDGKLAVAIAGTWGAPRIDGRFDLKGGTFEGLSTGTRLSNLALAVDANTTSARYTLTGRDSGSGKLTSEGKVTFDTARHFPLEGTLDVTALRIVGLDELSAIATGHAAVSGAMDAMLIKGDLTFDRVDALIPDKLPPSVPTLPVTYADAARADTGDEPEPKADTGGVALDFKVHVPGRASLNGRGLVSEWKGDLAVAGTTMTPIVTGEAKLQRGTLAFAGRSFPLTRGTVTFDGGEDIDPRLDIAAVRTVNSVAITLAVTGRSSAPKITITSDPTVPQDEAMALVLLGKPAGSLTPLELLDVARAVATLSGNSIGGGGLDVVDRARRALGLDVLTIDTSTGAGDDAKNITSSASLSAGRYVTDKVYLGVKQGAQTGSSAVELEIELTPNITATTEVGQEAGSSAGINWKWDY